MHQVALDAQVDADLEEERERTNIANRHPMTARNNVGDPLEINHSESDPQKSLRSSAKRSRTLNTNIKTGRETDANFF